MAKWSKEKQSYVWTHYKGEPSNNNSCLPCQHGEHVNCRHKMDGPRFADGKTIPQNSCQCERAFQHDPPHWRGTCSKWMSNEYGDGHRCGKPVKGTVEITPTFGNAIAARQNGEKVTVEWCGVHIAALRRREANDAKRNEEWTARDAAEAEHERRVRAEEDQAAILRDKGFNVEVGRAMERKNDRVGVLLNGETAVALVTAFEALCREVGIEAKEEIEQITKGGRV